MGLSGVLTDRARCIRQVRTGQKVDGMPQLLPAVTPWFRCRVEPADTSSQATDGSWTRTARTWLICSKRDEHFDDVRVLATDYIQIVSSDVDTGEDDVWQIDGDVTPMRKRKGVIGFEFKVNQVRERPSWMSSLRTLPKYGDDPPVNGEVLGIIPWDMPVA